MGTAPIAARTAGYRWNEPGPLMRVPLRMRTLFLLPALLPALSATAQCCCEEQVVEVHAPGPVHHAGTWRYTAHSTSDTGQAGQVDSVPGDPTILRLHLSTGCGIRQADWKLRDIRNGRTMQIQLQHLPGDRPLPTLSLAWAADRSLHVDMQEVLACMSSLEPSDTGYHQEEVQCRSGQVRFTWDRGRPVRFEPLDPERWTHGPSAPEADDAQQPGDPDGTGPRIADAALVITPASPSRHDSLLLRFNWVAGSCGRYRDTVVVDPPTAQRPWSEIAVGIGLVGMDCADVALRSRTIVLRPLPPGLYRVRFGAAPAGTTPVHVPAAGSYREILVR